MTAVTQGEFAYSPALDFLTRITDAVADAHDTQVRREERLLVHHGDAVPRSHGELARKRLGANPTVRDEHGLVERGGHTIVPTTRHPSLDRDVESALRAARHALANATSGNLTQDRLEPPAMQPQVVRQSRRVLP